MVNFEPIGPIAPVARAAATFPAENGERRATARFWAAMAAVGVISFTFFRMLAAEWSINPQYSYGWGVPFLALYLFWKRWPDRPEPGPTPSWALLPCWLALGLAILPLNILAESNPEWRLLFWAAGLLFCLAMSLLLLEAGGKPWLRHFAPPVLVTLLSVPWPSGPESDLVTALTHIVAVGSVEALRWIGLPALLQGNVIQTSSGMVSIAEACSGIRSLQTTLMAALFLGELHRLRLLQRAVLLGAGLMMAVALNFMRTTILTWLTAVRGPEAQAQYHDVLGFLVLGLSLLVVVLVAKGMAPAVQPDESPRAQTAAPGRLPSVRFTATVIIWLLTVHLMTETWFRMRERSQPAQPQWTAALPASAPGFTPQPLEEEILAVLRCDASESGVWKRPNGSEWTMFYIEWGPGRIAAQASRRHTPEICLQNMGFKLVERGNDLVLPVQGVLIPFQTYIFEANGEPWHVFFSLVEDGAPVQAQETSDQQIHDMARSERFRSAWEGRRHRGQRVLEVAMRGYQTQAQASEALASVLPDLIQIKE